MRPRASSICWSVILSATLQALTVPAAAHSLPDDYSPAFEFEGNIVIIEAGMGQLLSLPQPAATMLSVDPAVARIQPASPTSIYVMGVAAGITQLIATDRAGKIIARYTIKVQSPVQKGSLTFSAAHIRSAILEALPNIESLEVVALPNSLVLSGTVDNPEQAQQITAIVRAVAGEKVTLVNRIEVLDSIQVNVRVRVVEMSREISRQLGFNWQTLYGTGKFAIGLATGNTVTGLVAGAPAASQALSALNGRSPTLSDGVPSRLAGSLRTGNFDINAQIDALAADNQISVLAEPNLTALSGETASFLAGGEFPVPVAANQSGQITIEFKQFGVSLAVVPTVISSERLNLKVRPEVSELSDAGAINMPISGGVVRIPALAVRRAETTVELGSGQSFAIAGLLQRSSSKSASGIPGLSELPVLGALFRSKSFRKNETELVIIVTPYLVRPVSPEALVTPQAALRGAPATGVSPAARTAHPVSGAPSGPEGS